MALQVLQACVTMVTAGEVDKGYHLVLGSGLMEGS